MPSNHFSTLMQEYVHLSRYARWLPEEKRREMWPETVKRYFDFFEEHLKENYKYILTDRKALEDAVLTQKVMPSMRAIMTAGEALKRDPIAGYNCAYIAIDSPRSFDETLYILMCGTGVGFSVEKKYVRSMPVIEEEFHDTDTTIVVADSKTGWAKSLKELIHLLYSGQVPRWDVSRVRPAGAPLKTFGGRASGPEPLEDLFRFTVKLFKNAAGRKLSSIECHDLVCKIAEIVVVGGVRRSALISLSDLDDRDMRDAKTGRWWETHPHRMLANNSYVAKEKDMNVGTFMEEWNSLYASKSGERGIFSRYAAKSQAARSGRRNVDDHDFGCNPCSEIILRSRQFCNLTEVIVRSDDTEQSLLGKVEAATIMGTFQSTLTDFRYISKKWKENCEEERLLGVSLTGIMDCVLTNGKNGFEKTKKLLNKLRDKAVQVNKEIAKDLGINQSVAITCVKPSGTVSSLVDSSAGIHTRHAPYYIRTVRGDKKDPLAFMMQDMEFPHEDCVTKPDNVVVFSFPIKAPDDAVFRHDVNAIDQLNLWKLYQDEWCEHKPSVTISVKEHEWMEVGAWTYKNFASISGISFLPFSDAEYKQMPYQDCTKEQYEELLTKMPKQVDWTRLKDYEMYDTTTGTKEYACSSGSCDVIGM
jgi:ribonucleoside-triphosphate reductase (thioredoxin)